MTGDLTYSGSSFTIAGNNTIILYSDAGATVVDKVGFGSAVDFETLSFLTNPDAGQSIRRINNEDTDNNSVDFELLQVSSPRNSTTVVSPVTPTPAVTPLVTNTPVATPSVEPTQTPTETTIPTPSPTQSSVPTTAASATPTETATASASASPTPTTKPDKHHDKDEDNEYDLPFGFKCGFDRHEFRFKKVHFNYYKFHFGRR